MPTLLGAIFEKEFVVSIPPDVHILQKRRDAMSIGMSLEQRLTAVEAAIFEIQKQLEASQSID